MKINVIVSASERIKRKIEYSFTLLFLPLRAELQFTPTYSSDCVNIFYGHQPPSNPKKVFWVRASEDFSRCISEQILPDIGGVKWFEISGRRLPGLFPLHPFVDGQALEFDIAAATFILASNYQDLVSLQRDEFDRLRAMDSIQDQLGVLEIPVVNYYSYLLKNALEAKFSVLFQRKKYGNSLHALALSHDIDYTSSLNFRMVRRNIIGHALLNREHLYSQERVKKLSYPALAILGFDPPKSGMRFLRDTEEENQVKSTFFVKTGATAKEDVRYNYHSRRMRDFLNDLSDSGFEIGIHPSMKTYIDLDEFIREKTRLENLIGNRVNSVRQHYLRFTAGQTIGIWERAELKYDSTLGFSRKVGFRNSIAFPFPLYNFAEDRASSVVEVPLLIMDGTIADSGRFETRRALEKISNLLHETKVCCGSASVLFHNSIADPIDFPGYKDLYKQLIAGAKMEAFFIGTIRAVAENFS